MSTQQVEFKSYCPIPILPTADEYVHISVQINCTLHKMFAKNKLFIAYFLWFFYQMKKSGIFFSQTERPFSFFLNVAWLWFWKYKISFFRERKEEEKQLLERFNPFDLFLQSRENSSGSKLDFGKQIVGMWREPWSSG